MTDAFVDVPSVSARVGALSAEACVELFAAYGSEITPASTIAVKDELTLSGCQARDWMGEMANRLLGRLKMKLLGLGVDVTLTTPLAFSGVQLTPSPRGSVRPSLFSCASGLSCSGWRSKRLRASSSARRAHKARRPAT